MIFVIIITMIDKLINEIEIGLKNNLYLIALNTALTLPDICGKAEFPTESTTKRYINWYDNYISKYEKRPNDEMPYLSGEVLYSLRCSLLHQGNPNIEKGKGNIDKFILVIQKENIGIYADTSSITTHNNQSKTRTYKINVRGICIKLCSLAQKYYIDNKSKFDFFNYEIQDLDAAFELLKPFIINNFNTSGK